MTDYQFDLYARKRKLKDDKLTCIFFGGLALGIWIIVACVRRV